MHRHWRVELFQTESIGHDEGCLQELVAESRYRPPVHAQLPRWSGFALIGHDDTHELFILLYPAKQLKLVRSLFAIANSGNKTKLKLLKSNII
jgi:hypothetical protein